MSSMQTPSKTGGQNYVKKWHWMKEREKESQEEFSLTQIYRRTFLLPFSVRSSTILGGGCGSGGREGHLLLARLAVQSPTSPKPCAEVSLSKILNPTLLPMGRVAPCMAARRRR